MSGDNSTELCPQGTVENLDGVGRAVEVRSKLDMVDLPSSAHCRSLEVTSSGLSDPLSINDIFERMDESMCEWLS